MWMVTHECTCALLYAGPTYIYICICISEHDLGHQKHKKCWFQASYATVNYISCHSHIPNSTVHTIYL